MAPIGLYLKRDNPRCATRTEGARVCVDMDISREPFMAIWVGIPRQTNSYLQEIKYETLPAYCMHCSMQGHNSKTCKWKTQNFFEKNQSMVEGRRDLVWVCKDQKQVIDDKDPSSDN